MTDDCWMVRTRRMLTAPLSIDKAWTFMLSAAVYGISTDLELCDPFPAFEVEL